DYKLYHRFFDLFELERFDDGLQFFHVEVNSISRGALYPAFAALRRGRSKAMCSTRSHSNAAMRMQSRIFCATKNGSSRGHRGDRGTPQKLKDHAYQGKMCRRARCSTSLR